MVVCNYAVTMHTATYCAGVHSTSSYLLPKAKKEIRSRQVCQVLALIIFVTAIGLNVSIIIETLASLLICEERLCNLND